MSALRSKIRAATPTLTAAVDKLCARWLAPLDKRLGNSEFRPKQINDAIWGSVELTPWEVALLDTPLLQRMRGVRQLGLAQLVFPGAIHDRLEHIVGVVGAVEQMIATLDRQIARWNRDPRNSARQLPGINEGDRYRLRLAALFHDLGHGPFSHAIEPVLEVASPLGTTGDAVWREELAQMRLLLQGEYALNSAPATSEVIAVAIILSDAVSQLLGNDNFMERGRWAAAAKIQEQLTACIIGAVEGPGADHLCAIVSSQLDADRTDYLARDAHHSGLHIGFDTERLLSKLEVLQIRADNTPGADAGLRERIARRAPDPVLQIGIAASGFGSFEQMLIGRTFLYDRLYHHHKVRAAEAMAQRMMLVSERDRSARFSLEEIFLSIGDDTLVRIIAEEVSHSGLATNSPAAARLARGLIDRDLLHRAFAFRSRFIATPPGLDADVAEDSRHEQWRRLLKGLDGLGKRYDVGEEIYDLAKRIIATLKAADVDVAAMDAYDLALDQSGPEQIIVDLPIRKADAIRILARYPDGNLKVPEFSFNPVKWADAYDLQKRTGYVFCPRGVVPVISLAARIVFLSRFGVVMGTDADGVIKAARAVEPQWLAPLVAATIMDQETADLLDQRRHSLIAVRADDLCVPSKWIEEDPYFAIKVLTEIKKHVGAGLSASSLKAFSAIMEAMFAFVDLWYDGGGGLTAEIADEADLQERLGNHFRSRSMKVEEGTAVGGGKLDLYVEESVLIENKWQSGTAATPDVIAPSAGIQGRRYAISLMSQIIITAAAYRQDSGKPVSQKTDLIEVRQITKADGNRAEIRFNFPYGAKTPSRDKGS